MRYVFALIVISVVLGGCKSAEQDTTSLEFPTIERWWK